jgi:hypothetical protein
LEKCQMHGRPWNRRISIAYKPLQPFPVQDIVPSSRLCLVCLSILDSESNLDAVAAFQSLMQQQQQWRLLRYWRFCYQRSKENQVFVRQIQKFCTPKSIQSCGTSFHFTRFGASSSCLTRLGASSQKLGWLLVMT